MVSISEFRHVVKFENVNKTANTSSGKREVYLEFFTCRASMKKKEGFRKFEDGLDRLIQVYRMECYWRHEIELNLTKDTRIVFNNRFFRIESFDLINESRMFYQFILSEAT